jgi:hypothetical protein
VAMRRGFVVLGLSIAAIVAACTAAPSSAPIVVPTVSAAPSSAAPAGSPASLTVVVSTMATATAVIPDICEAGGPAATDYPSRYSFTVSITDATGADVTNVDASALLGKMGHLTLSGPPEAGTYDAPIAHGSGGGGLNLIFLGGYCKTGGFSTFETLTIDGVPLTAQPDGTWRGTLTVP